MKHRMARVFLFLTAAAAFAALHGGGTAGCGSVGLSSPPVNIPAPVAGLISVTSPDPAGSVHMTGAAGSVEAGATVSVSLGTPAALTLKNAALPLTIVANADGSFTIDFDAALGDTLSVTQTVDASASDPSLYPIPEGHTLVASVPIGAAFSQNFSEGCVLRPLATGDGVDCFSPSTLDLTDEFSLSFTSGSAADLSVDDATGDFYVADPSAGRISVVNGTGGLKANVTVAEPLAVASDTVNQFAVVGQLSASPAMTIIDNTSSFPTLGASTSVSHPTNGSAVALRTIAVSMDRTSIGNTRMAALTVFDNGDTVLTYYTMTPPPGGSFAVIAQINLGPGTFDSVVLYNNAAEALVSDYDGARVIHFSGANLSTQVSIDVGNHPRGVAVSEARNFGFVCNQTDHTVSIVDLSQNSVAGTMTTIQGVGLEPVDIAINASPFTGLISNQGDSTVTVFDVAAVLTQLGL